MNVLFFIPSFSSGGAEAFIVNLMENIDRDAFRCELLCIDRVPGVYDKRLEDIQVNSQVLVDEVIGNPIVRYVKAYRAFKRFIRENKNTYDVIHFNIAQGEELPFIHMAKKAGVPVRILHSHNSSVNSTIKYIGHVLCKLFYRREATAYLACSDIAAEWLLPARCFKSKKYKIIKNGISTDRYRYDLSQREITRRELGVGAQPVFLNIGRLNHQKNQTFLIDTFQKISAQLPDALLLVAGEGDLRQELEEKTAACGLSGRIRWLGNRNDIPALLSAADVFLLPSLFEGLPFTIIEAQASGIPCVIADTISEECVITELVYRIPLDVDEYADCALSAYKAESYGNRVKYADAVRMAGFDIHKTVSEMEQLYNG